MSRETEVLLRPDEVRVTRGGFRRGAAVRRFAVTAQNGNGAEPWRAAFERLTEALLELDVHGGALRVALSDHFLHYALVPWSENLVSDSERLAFARLTLGKVYGALAESWELCMDDQPAGQPAFACGVDRALLQALRRLSTQRGLRLRSLVPAFAARVNRHRRGLNAPAFCLASVEPGRLTLAFRSAAGWTAVRSRRSDAPLSEALPAALKQESLAGGSAPSGVLYLVGEDVAQVPPFPIPGWQVTRLSEEAPAARVEPGLARVAG